MVWRRLISIVLAFAVLWIAGCKEEREMAESMEIPDTMVVKRAMEDAAARDALLDTMPGGEMARGDSTAEMKLLKKKM